MAQITATTAEKIFPISAWGGLHESPDGDTELKIGEAAAMRNFRVTRDGNLQRRPGTRPVFAEVLIDRETLEESWSYPSFGHKPVAGMWTGFVDGEERFLVACNGKVYSIWDADNDRFYSWLEVVEIGSITTTGHVHMFGFEGKVYFLNGSQYKVWDGTNFKDVITDAYIPLVAVAVTPEPKTGSQTLEQINKLSSKRRVWLSPDGVGNVFHLPESGLASVDSVTNLADGTTISTYTANLTTGIITFDSAPAQATNSIEVAYTMPDTICPILTTKYSELFSGQTDSRIFLYGNGTNKIYYSSIDYDGKPRADYFPDLNEAAIGDENTPVTALIRHYSKLVIFKSNSTWTCTFNVTTLADGTSAEVLNIYPVNKRLGHTPLGQTALVLNSPRSLFGNDCYEWKNNNAYAANLSVDERQAKRISDRVFKTLSQFDMSKCLCWDDNDAQEYWIYQGNKALIHNYAVDAWYLYTNINATCFLNFHKTLYIGGSDGVIRFFSDAWNSDTGEVIDAYWESGSMAFGQDYKRKYSAMLWLGLKPTSQGEVSVTVQTDRKPSNSEKVVFSRLATFENADFWNWSFNTNQNAKIYRKKIKAKKFVYYKLIFRNNEINTSATITASDIRVRYTGYAK